MWKCWNMISQERPNFEQIVGDLESLYKLNEESNWEKYKGKL